MMVRTMKVYSYEEPEGVDVGVRLIKISALYFLIGVGIGYYMSTAHAYNLTSVHVHNNLLGWTALTLAGIIYILFPEAGRTKLAKWHFGCIISDYH